jgi:2-polyprenyl-3-methyl-5-hydroxy-6-metoxy-1,4-benzoquinol methylase
MKNETRQTEVSDNLWLKANLDPEFGRTALGIEIPDLPPSEIQLRFTGETGQKNLQQAFDFYRFVLEHSPKIDKGKYKFVDFGGGWGRILRFFLREYNGENLMLCDCLTDAVECARSLNPAFQILQNGTLPPLSQDDISMDCCYAFSVFSHLNEEYTVSWLKHLCELLTPDGKMIFTTRGTQQIRVLMRYRRYKWILQLAYKMLGRTFSAVQESLSKFPHPDKILKDYQQGKFLFFPTGGGGELADNFYGETWIPPKWMEKNYKKLGFQHCEFWKEFNTVNQCVYILTK